MHARQHCNTMPTAGSVRLIVGGCPAGPDGPETGVSTVAVVDYDASTFDVTLIGVHNAHRCAQCTRMCNAYAACQ